eukprot:1162059-Pelagomonas_calceolata.AAC.4
MHPKNASNARAIQLAQLGLMELDSNAIAIQHAQPDNSACVQCSRNCDHIEARSIEAFTPHALLVQPMHRAGAKRVQSAGAGWSFWPALQLACLVARLLFESA